LKGEADPFIDARDRWPDPRYPFKIDLQGSVQPAGS
jgi:hypothetical protein